MFQKWAGFLDEAFQTTCFNSLFRLVKVSLGSVSTALLKGSKDFSLLPLAGCPMNSARLILCIILFNLILSGEMPD
jgi:hypothetical protein